jgi:DNA-binding phage protein
MSNDGMKKEGMSRDGMKKDMSKDGSPSGDTTKKKACNLSSLCRPDKIRRP